MCHQQRDVSKDAFHTGAVDVVVTAFAGEQSLGGAGRKAADELDFCAGEAMFGRERILKLQAEVVQSCETVVFGATGAAITRHGGSASAQGAFAGGREATIPSSVEVEGDGEGMGTPASLRWVVSAEE